MITLCLGAVVTSFWFSALEPKACPDRDTLRAVQTGLSKTIAQDPLEVRVLALASHFEREFAGGPHAYSIKLVSGEYLRIMVKQQSLDLSLKVFQPDGVLLAEVNNTSDLQDLERVSLIAETVGDYRLELHAVRKDARGSYVVKIEELRVATPQHSVHIEAERAFGTGRRYFSQRTGEALREAIKNFEEALELYRQAGDRHGEVRALNSISETFLMLGEGRKAMAISLEAFPLSQFLEDRRLQAHTARSLAMAYERTDDPWKALEYRTQALTLWRELGDRRWEASALGGIGVIYSVTDEPQKSLEYYTQALKIFRELTDVRGEASMLNNLGGLYSDWGDYEKALDHYFQVLSLIKNAQHGKAAVVHNMGIAYHLKGEPGKALEYYQQALSLNQNAGNRAVEAETLARIGMASNDLGDPQKALDYLNRALAISRELGIRLREANIIYYIGMVHLSIGERPKALTYFRQALTLSRNIGSRSLEATSLYSIARIERDEGNLIRARATIDAALEIVESLRSKIARQELSSSFFASVENHYQFYIDLLMRLHQGHPAAGHDAEALEMSERSRARSLLDSLAEARADIRQGVEPALLERERTLQQQLNIKAERLTNLFNARASEEQAIALRKELDSLVSQYQELQSQIRLSSPRYAALTQPKPLTVKEIQRELDHDSLLLEYALGSDRSFVWAVTSTSLTSYVLPNEAQIQTAARRVYQLLTARSQQRADESPEARAARTKEAEVEFEKAAAKLSQMLFGPVANRLGARRLIIVSEGALQYVPFGALPKFRLRAAEARYGGGAFDVRIRASAHRRVTPKPLIAEHEIVTLPSASVLAEIRRELQGRTSAPKAVAVLADPVFRADDPRLTHATNARREIAKKEKEIAPVVVSIERSARESGVTEFKRLRFSRQEAEAITNLAGDEKSFKAIDFAANRATATSPELGRYRVLHFATHGLLNSQHPELSGIVLSLVNEQGDPQDGFLRLHEIYNLKLGADLVVLSACQTALGREVKREGLVGLTRGFMYAGVPRVVASLWNVDDRATAELMKRFYWAMFTQGMRPAAALRAAQTSLQSEKGWSAPYYWAGFTLQGEWK